MNAHLSTFVRTAGLAATVLVSSVQAVDDLTDDPSRLGDLSIEQLMNESVTSVSRKEESLFDAAAAVSVLSNEDLRRSGATTVADALRTIPGLNVAAVNASDWAISARGFNGFYSNMLLVLVDGRSVYTPVFAGVYWDMQQMMIEDIDRIEVIRGPGATIWGANAVNGVINIVTREAADTQGQLFYGGGGDVRQALGGARYGGRIGENTAYRAFAGYQRTADFPLASGQDAGDRWQSGHGGFRIDRELAAHSRLTWQADATLSNVVDGTAHGANLNTLARWTRRGSSGSNLEVQGYFDHSYRNEPQRSRNTVDTTDLAFHHSFELSEHNDLIWGLGYRYSAGTFEQTSPQVQVRDGAFGLQLLSGFVQNKFEWLPDRLNLTSGVKLEHNDFTGIEIQPSLRLSFKPTGDQTLWSAVSRAARTPSLIEGSDLAAITIGPPFTGPGGGRYAPTLVGNPALRSEVLWAYELGYRIRPAERVSVDLAAFYNDYSRLTALESGEFKPGAPVGIAEFPFTNSQRGETRGIEAATTYTATDRWRLTAQYTLLLMRLHGPASTNPEATEDASPRHQASLRSSTDFGAGSLDTQLRYVSEITGAPAYLTADLRLTYRPLDRLEFSLVGQNLFDRQHPEQARQPPAIASEVPRGVYAKLTWRF